MVEISRSVPKIPGILESPEETERLQHEISRLLDRRGRSFPGSQPVSFARKHLEQNLKQEDYYVCEKSDGMRCLMYLTQDPMGNEATYLVTRSNEYFYVDGLHFPLPSSDPSRFHTGCIIDGELVISKTRSGEMLEYLMFDMLVFQGKDLTQRPLDKRLGYLQQDIASPLKQLYRNFPEDVKAFPFFTRMKDMKLSSQLQEVINSLPNLAHVSDGLIFTPLTPYVSGTDPKLLKWKPPEENTVDFKLEMEFRMYADDEESYTDYDSLPTCHLAMWLGNRDYSRFTELYLEKKEWEDLKALGEPLQGRILECNQDDDHQWRYMRFRDDKENANHSSTVEKVLESIQDRVDKEELIAAAPEIRANRKSRDAERKHQATSAKRPSSSSEVPYKRAKHED